MLQTFKFPNYKDLLVYLFQLYFQVRQENVHESFLLFEVFDANKVVSLNLHTDSNSLVCVKKPTLHTKSIHQH